MKIFLAIAIVLLSEISQPNLIGPMHRPLLANLLICNYRQMYELIEIVQCVDMHHYMLHQQLL